MNILNEVQEILVKYDLKPLELPDGHKNIYKYLNANPEKRNEYVSSKDDSYLLEKYGNYIPMGWYGFSLGSPIILKWNEAIDEILELCVKHDPNFIIHQIKMKFGGVRFYVESEIIEDIFDVCRLVESKLYDTKLIY